MTNNGRQLVEALHSEAVAQAAHQPWPDAELPTIHYTELSEARPDSPLYREWNTYRREVGRFLAAGHEGRHILIKEEQIIGIWDSHEEAIAAGYERFLGQPFLVHQIQERERLLRFEVLIGIDFLLEGAAKHESPGRPCSSNHT